MMKKRLASLPVLLGAVSLLSLVFLAFVTGAAVADFKVFPYRQIFAEPFAYVHANMEQKREIAEHRFRHQDVPAEGRITVPAAQGVYPGYTFVTYDSIRPSTARLFDLNGKLVHEWHRDFREIWPTYESKSRLPSELAFSWRYGEIFPNGDIIVVVKAHGATPYGYGLVRLDKNSKVVWARAEHFHHHFSIGSNGNIYAVMHDWRDTTDRPIPGLVDAPLRVLASTLVELSPEGEILRRVDLVDAMSSPGARELLASAFANGFDAEDWDLLHPNDAEVVEPEMAAKHPFMKAGSVLLSLRDLDALVLVDMDTQQVIWTMRGPWIRQHDPDFLENGDILLFDNRGDGVPESGSRVIQVNPSTGLVNWSYRGTAEKPFRSDVCGGNERLPNGNILITEEEGGRVFEITAEGKIIWEYTDVRMHHATRTDAPWLSNSPVDASH